VLLSLSISSPNSAKWLTIIDSVPYPTHIGAPTFSSREEGFLFFQFPSACAAFALLETDYCELTTNCGRADIFSRSPKGGVWGEICVLVVPRLRRYSDSSHWSLLGAHEARVTNHETRLIWYSKERSKPQLIRYGSAAILLRKA